MPNSPAGADTKSSEEIHAMIAQLDDLMKRSVLEMGAMEEIEARVKAISRRIVRMTPPPDPSAVRDER